VCRSSCKPSAASRGAQEHARRRDNDAFAANDGLSSWHAGAVASTGRLDAHGVGRYAGRACSRGFTMNDDRPSLPHFLRVARSLASARGMRRLALPVATTAAIGFGCGGTIATGMGGNGSVSGTGGVTSTSPSTGPGGAGYSVMPSTASSSGTGGYDGGFMGFVGDAGWNGD
jgi:hypothetical protein